MSIFHRYSELEAGNALWALSDRFSCFGCFGEMRTALCFQCVFGLGSEPIATTVRSQLTDKADSPYLDATVASVSRTLSECGTVRVGESVNGTPGPPLLCFGARGVRIE